MIFKLKQFNRSIAPMTRSWILLTTCLITFNAPYIQADFVTLSPGDRLPEIVESIRERLLQCHLTELPGNHPKLPNQIRARNVDTVFVHINPRNQIKPIILMDWQLNTKHLNLVFSNSRGGNVAQLSRDYSMNDIALNAFVISSKAFSRSFFSNQRLHTTFHIDDRFSGRREVSETEFDYFIESRFTPGLSEWICKQAPQGSP